MSRAIIVLLLLCPLIGLAQVSKVTLSGIIQDTVSQERIPYANVVIRNIDDGAFVGGTVTNDYGLFSLAGISPGSYLITVSYVGFATRDIPIRVGRLSEFLDIGVVDLAHDSRMLDELEIRSQQDIVAETMEKKVFRTDDIITGSGGSLLQVMKNLPGVTVTQEGTVRLRGSDKVTVLVDGKQTALTGFGNQTSLDNIPASSIERIEVINNPSAKYDANGNAGIINIIYKKEADEGFNGRVGLALGVGALWIKKENYPTIRPQYQNTPKINPSVSLNYRKKKVNVFLQADNLYTKTLNKNEFVDRYYDNGDTIRQQTKRNRTTNIVTGKGGVDWMANDHNQFTASALFSIEDIIDLGDEPFFNSDLTERLRLWQFLEDEVKTTVTLSASWQHKYLQPGRLLSAGYNYTFHREDEKYFFTNTLPSFTGEDSFKLISDEHVSDFTVDYAHPLKSGRFETGLKLRLRNIPTNMQFFPGINSPLDVDAGGYAKYSEVIPAIYGNYIFESEKLEVEAGLRVEYADINYEVDPSHNTYESDGYHYIQPFPNVRFTYKLNSDNTLSLFYTRRVDRPNEVDIRIFPKYDDVEIIKVGNPGLRPQFTSSVELGYKSSSENGYIYTALYHKRMESTIVRIASSPAGSPLIYNIFQNAGDSHTTGIEIILSRNLEKWASLNLNLNGYHNTIEAFTVVNKYPEENTFSAARQETFSGNIKLNGVFHLAGQMDLQLSMIYLAPDVVPQGKTYSRFFVDVGVKKAIQRGKGEVFINASDLANTSRLRKEVAGDGFRYYSTDYYETQIIRLGYSYKF